MDGILKRRVLDLAEMAEIENTKITAAQSATNVEDLTLALIELGELVSNQDDALVELAELIEEGE